MKYSYDPSIDTEYEDPMDRSDELYEQRRDDKREEESDPPLLDQKSERIYQERIKKITAMKTKSIVSVAIILVMCFSIIYLFGAFAFATFNMALWDADKRLSLAVTALVATIVVYLIYSIGEIIK